MLHTCFVCMREFEHPQPHKKTCGKTCAAAHENKRRRDKRAGRPRTPTIVKCVICGRDFQRRTIDVACSFSCKKENDRANERARPRRIRIWKPETEEQRERRRALAKERRRRPDRKPLTEEQLEKRRAYHRKYGSEHRIAIRENDRKYRQRMRAENPEKQRRYNREYIKANPEKRRGYDRSKSAKRMQKRLTLNLIAEGIIT